MFYRKKLIPFGTVYRTIRVIQTKLSSSSEIQDDTHCPKSNPNFRDIKLNVVENMISLSQITREFSRYRLECNCYKSKYMGKVRDWLKLKYLGVLREPQFHSPLEHCVYLGLFVINISRTKITARVEI